MRNKPPQRESRNTSVRKLVGSILAVASLYVLPISCGRGISESVEQTVPVTLPQPTTTVEQSFTPEEPEVVEVEEAPEIQYEQAAVPNPEFSPEQRIGLVTATISGPGRRSGKGPIIHPLYVDSRVEEQVVNRVPMDINDGTLMKGFVWPRDTHYPGKDDGEINPEDLSTRGYTYPTIVFSHRATQLTGDPEHGTTAMLDIDKILTRRPDVPGDTITLDLATGTARYEAVDRRIISVDDPVYDAFIGDPRPYETVILGACGPEPGQVSHRILVEYQRIIT